MLTVITKSCFFVTLALVSATSNSLFAHDRSGVGIYAPENFLIGQWMVSEVKINFLATRTLSYQ
jgi:hypothetical protein